MPIRFQTSLDLDLVYTEWWGEVSMNEWRASFTQYLADANYRPGRRELIDFTNVETIDAGFNSIWSALNLVNQQVPGRKIRTRSVFIAPGDVVFGLTRIYQTLAQNADGIEVEIYREPGEAFAALDLGFGSIVELVEKGNFLPHVPAGVPSDGT